MLRLPIDLSHLLNHPRATWVFNVTVDISVSNFVALIPTQSVIYLVLVAILWGATNPLLKKGAIGIYDVEAVSVLGQFFKEVYFLVTNLKWLIPFLMNQCGSILYVVTLEGADFSLAVPVTNSLTFVVTAITGWILGEEKPHRNVYIGILLILAGTTVCCYDKLNSAEELLS